MTAPDSQSRRNGTGSTALGILIGGAIGFVVAAVLVGAVGFVYAKTQAADARAGWNLVPVVVASADLPADTVITVDMLSQRAVPEQFVTSSIVQPENVKWIVNRKLRVPMQKSDPMLWTHFETGD